MRLVEDTQQILHMVTHLMGNHIGIREIAVGTQVTLHRGEERQVDIQTLVGRAIERTYLRITCTTTGIHTTGIEHHLWGNILAPHLLEHLGPHILCTCEDLTGELRQCLLLFCELSLTVLRGNILTLSHLLTHIINHVTDISSPEESHQSDNHDTANTQTGSCATSHTATVIYIITFSSTV